ncbi:MAG: EF-P beta-lysylation protein EpmB [Planctomycetaceae bacterium]
MSRLPGLNPPKSAARNAAEPHQVPEADEVSWQREMADAICDPAELLECLQLTPADVPDADVSGDSLFRTLVPRSFVRRMKPGDPADPLLRQVLPMMSERRHVDGFVPDAVNDHAAHRAPGLLQKYAGRVLLIASGACAVHCRYCFRREYPYGREPRRLKDWRTALNAIRDDSSISEVIFSGGDPFMLNDRRLSELCRLADEISHVERIRFHTRLPVVLPSRVTPELLTLLTSLRSQAVIVIHANHGNEIVDDCADALRSIVRSGLPVLNQTVLLKGINDSVDVLRDLSRRLINTGVMPYYLHQLDQVAGTAHFQVDAARGRVLVDELAKQLPGYAVPRFVQEVAGEASKRPA